MMRTVQLAVADAAYTAALRDALSKSGPWHVEIIDRPDPALSCVLVLDESSLKQIPLPLARPERVVLISHQDPQLLAQAWDVGIVSIVSPEDTMPTVLLAIMAASLRVAKLQEKPSTGGISPNHAEISARISPSEPGSRPKRCRTP